MTTSSKGLQLSLLTIATALLGAPGCRVVGGIFKAGVWTGVIVLFMVVALVFGISRLFART